MSTISSTLRRRLSTLVAVAGLGALAGCSGVTYAETQLPTTPAPKPSSSAPAVAAPTCTNATQSYDPLPSLPTRADISDGTMRKILDKGFITVGVSADTYLFGARNAFTGGIEGFDIDMARAVAKAIFGDASKVQLRVITADDRKPLLKNREIDMVARNMSMTCDRWNDIGFSAEYYRSGQKVLVSKALPGAKDLTLADLKGKRVCAPNGTTSLAKLQQVKGPVVVTAGTHTGCLVLLQQGKADAITGDDTVLAGLAAQDPNTVITSAKAITVEPYGLGVNKADVYLARYLNRVIADLEADGEWKTIYNRWLAAPLGPAPAPPTPVYGR
ncbi:transporter substrate-binding protein [Terrabacter sp. Root85]|uniref:glutamate ABC transporter substrate-binding protein n=1 Tax=unclassified Terrabacter TaxID=2630222 RepID=UPI00070089CE|nr:MULTISPECIES: glutamate ABC transporter substrate-binding protein [unclassified Terrabacter]KRC88192.1 transporter substrate-binding protein [Terrabacter sp. Root85]KRF45468.1 transporter substrate-binding protein [Terrabacter sp. Soil811]